MAEFYLGRLKFVWKGPWATSTSYIKDDIVQYGGRTYVCTTGHTSSATTTLGLENDISNWNLHTSGIQWSGVWTSGTRYKVSDAVSYGGGSYVCIAAHTSTTDFDELKFQSLASGTQFEGVFSSATSYQVGDIVTYGGNSYICIQDSLNNLPTNTSYWSLVIKGQSYQGNYNNATAYKPGELVTYSANVYLAKSNTTGNLPTNTSYWDLYTNGILWKDGWTDATVYVTGDSVSYNNSSYTCILNHTSSVASITPLNLTYWTISARGFNWVGAWVNSTVYQKNDVVQFSGQTYFCILAHTSNTASDIDPPNATYWQLMAAGLAWRGVWSSSTTYQLNDIVQYNGSSYASSVKDNLNNTPSPVSASWSLVSRGLTWQGTWSSATTYQINDIVLYQGSTYFSIAATNLNQNPSTATSYWTQAGTGLKFQGTYSAATTYAANDMVLYNGSTFISLVNTNLNRTPNSSPTYWGMYARGLAWQGNYSSATTYLTNDLVQYSGSAYISIVDNNLNRTPNSSPTYWSLYTQGDVSTVTTTRGDLIVRGAVSNQRLPIGVAGSILVSDGTDPSWATNLNLSTNGLLVKDARLDTTSTSITTTTQTSVYSYTASSYRTAEFLVQIVDSSASHYHTTKILVIHDGTNTWMTQYGVINTVNELGTFDTDISGGSVRLLFTASEATTKTVKVLATMLTA